LVWALAEQSLPNFLTPRDCPRVGFRAVETTTQADIERFFSSSARHCVAIEYGWHRQMLETTLFVYEFDIANFHMGGGFYVSEHEETPIDMIKYDNLYEELFNRNVEVRILNNLWELGDAVQKSTLQWSLCRMKYAKPKE
jgi:hypothetical protein